MSKSLAIAYNIKKKNAKKMAKGGKVDISAASEGMPTADSDQMSAAKRPEYSSKTMPNFHDEGRASADSAATHEEMAMLHKYRAHLASGGPVEVDFVSAKMDGIDDAHTPESSNMIKGKPTKHASELRAASGMPVADDKDEYGDEMLHKKAPADAYDLSSGRVKYARGGVISPEDEMDEERHASMAAAIMAKRKKYADGGMVDLQKNNGDEDLNNLDDLNYEAARKKTYYDDSQISKQPMDSNEMGDDLMDEDENGKPMISAIRRKMKARS